MTSCNTDTCFQTLFEIFSSTKSHVESLFPAAIAVIANILPEQRHLARATSLKLMILFERLSKHDFLMKQDSNSTMVLNLLSSINELIERHVNGTYWLPKVFAIAFLHTLRPAMTLKA